METAGFIKCPYCHHVHGSYEEHIEFGDTEGNYAMECEECDREFIVDFYSVFYFTAEEVGK